MIPPRTDIPEPWLGRYRKARAALYAMATAIALVAVFRIVFPSQVLAFDFTRPGSLSNLLSDPRNAAGGASLTDGKLGDHAMLVTDAGVIGRYSDVSMSIAPHPKSATPFPGGSIAVRKSYASFFLPVADTPAPFPAGTLLVSDGRYAIIDGDGRRVTFASPGQWQDLDYRSEAFLPVGQEEFSRNPDGGTWTSDTDYPSGTLFLIADNYYQLDGGTLRRFVSDNAYHSRYDAAQAIAQGRDFLGRFATSEDWIGFRTGTLLQYADGVFFVNKDRLQPIGSPEIFEALGFDWARVVPASAEETGIYARGKVALLGSPQPDGTVFHDRDTGRYFVVSGTEKYRVESVTLLAILTRGSSPIDVSSRALETVGRCTPEKRWWSGDWSCAVSLADFAALPGNSYEIAFTPAADTPGIRLSSVTAVFSSTVEMSSFRSALSQIKQQIVDRYTR